MNLFSFFDDDTTSNTDTPATKVDDPTLESRGYQPFDADCQDGEAVFSYDTTDNPLQSYVQPRDIENVLAVLKVRYENPYDKGVTPDNLYLHKCYGTLETDSEDITELFIREREKVPLVYEDGELCIVSQQEADEWRENLHILAHALDDTGIPPATQTPPLAPPDELNPNVQPMEQPYTPPNEPFHPPLKKQWLPKTPQFPQQRLEHQQKQRFPPKKRQFSPQLPPSFPPKRQDMLDTQDRFKKVNDTLQQQQDGIHTNQDKIRDLEPLHREVLFQQQQVKQEVQGIKEHEQENRGDLRQVESSVKEIKQDIGSKESGKEQSASPGL